MTTGIINAAVFLDKSFNKSYSEFMADTIGNLALNKHYTYADYKDWKLVDGERYELIYGRAYCISKPDAYGMSAPGAYHQLILGELYRQIATYLIGKPCKVFPAPFDVRLFYEEDENDGTVVQPDISIICDPKKRGPEGVRGAPDFIAEILSPSNTAIEMERKFHLYREAGVREYWVINPEQKALSVYNFKDGVVFPFTYHSTDTVKVGIFSDLGIVLESVFADNE